MSTHSERLEIIINKLNLNARSFAIEIGYSRADSIYAIFKRNSKISNSLLNKICNRFPQVNREWLMTGYGTMFTTQENDDLTVTAKQVIDKLQSNTESLKSQMKNIQKQLTLIQASLLGIEVFHGLDIKTKTIKKKNV